MSKHTPGPLSIHLSESAKWDEEGDYAIAAADRKILGEAYRTVDYGDTRPAEANARLWAAAPDLLSTLRIAAEFLQHYYDHLCKEGDSFAEDVAEEMAAVHAAISKATCPAVQP